MKKILAIVAIAITTATHAQTPYAIPYQAVARNSSGAILAGSSISVRFSVRDSIATGSIRYRETHSVTTTPQGLFTANVGGGTPVIGAFSNINWTTNAKYLQVELDPAGGSTYIDMGTQQMLSVPYALHATSVKLRVSSTGDTLYSGNGNYVIIPGISAANCTVSAGTITGTATVTAGSTTTLSNATTGGTWSSSNTGIATVGTGGVVSGIAAGTATISYTVTNSCGSAVATRAVTVNANPMAIGTNFGGGKIAYILQPGDPGYIAGETRGLIAAPSDQSTGIQWGCYGTLVGGTNTAIGSGAANTATVSAACGTGTAARLCDDLVLGGYSDWYLPSLDELQKLYANRIYLGVFGTGNYWSSSEHGSGSARFTYFADGTSPTVSNVKPNLHYVRAIRSFSYPEAISGTGTICVSGTITLSSITTGGVWSSGNTGVATVNSSGIVSGVAAGTATISYTVTEVSGTYTTTRVVTVNALPSAGTITGTATVTAGSTTTLSNATSGGAWSSSNTGIATVGTGGVVSGVAAGTATISYTVTNSCGSAVATQVVTVNAAILTVGMSYGGGIIAYILEPGDPGYIAGETHGLIAAPSDQSTGTVWGCRGTLVGGTNSSIGSGAANTAIVSAACGTGTAARLCDDLVLNGHSDWYLPSIDELQKLYINRISIGGFTSGFYWSSREFNLNHAKNLYFSDGTIGNNDKGGTDKVRAVRSF